MPEVKYTRHFLNRLEDLFSESDYFLRYEKGSFKSGYCILQDKKVVVINKYYPLEGKINCLLDIVRELKPELTNLSDKNNKLLQELSKTE
jgi:hypothetical protein